MAGTGISISCKDAPGGFARGASGSKLSHSGEATPGWTPDVSPVTRPPPAPLRSHEPTSRMNQRLFHALIPAVFSRPSGVRPEPRQPGAAPAPAPVPAPAPAGAASTAMDYTQTLLDYFMEGGAVLMSFLAGLSFLAVLLVFFYLFTIAREPWSATSS